MKTDHIKNGCVIQGTRLVKCTDRNVESIVIPDGVEIIGPAAFRACDKLASVTIPEGVFVIGEQAFQDCPLTSVVFPESLAQIGEEAFWRCNHIPSVRIPPFVSEFKLAFYDCRALTTVVISEGIVNIGYGAFYFCPCLSTVVLPSTLKYVAATAFDECGALKICAIPVGCTVCDNSFPEACVLLPPDKARLWRAQQVVDSRVGDGVDAVGFHTGCGTA